MKTLKKLLFAALATIGFSFAAQAEPILGEPTPIDGGWTRTITDASGTAIVNVYTNISTKGYTFTVPDNVFAIDYLVVGGGGAGGSSGTATGGGGGGGGGGVVSNIAPCSVVTGSALTITVGAGGTVGTSVGGDGGTSKILDGGAEIVAARGGGGGAGGSKAASSTGANGGGGNPSKTTGGTGVGPAGDNVGGYNGGKGNSGNNAKTGGGGAGAGHGGYAPVTSGTKHAGNGGEGVYSGITGEIICYGGGGGGGKGSTGSNTYAAGLGGDGGGGAGGTSLAGYAGTDGLGGGGGGNGNSTSSSAKGGKGGSGVVVIRYTPMVAFGLSWDSSTCGVKAFCGEEDVTEATMVPTNAVVVVTAYPNPTFEYTTIPEGWEVGENGTIVKTRTWSADYTLEVPSPEKTGGGELVSVDFIEAQNATKLATVGGEPLTVTMVEKDTEIVVVAIPNAYYEYAVIPDDWSAGEEGTITRTYVAASDTTITIPEPAPIMVQINVQGLENTTFVIKTNEEEIANGSYVQEGTAVTVVVTPQGIYEYSAAPEGWTKNADGTIVCERMAERAMEPIVVPSENLRKKQVAVKFVARGASYVATNLVKNVQITSGDKVNVDATIAIVAKPYSGEYSFDAVLPEGWSFGENGAIVGEVVAASSIEIPTATWTPIDGELIENGGFEYLDASEYSCAKGFPASLAGSWGGYCSGSMIQSNCYGLWKKGGNVDNSWTVWGSPHGGTYAAGATADGASTAYITVTFTTPSQSRLSSEYKFNFYAKAWRDTSMRKASIKVVLKKGNAEVQTLDGDSLDGSWRLFEYTLTNLEKNTKYTLQFLPREASRSFAIDDVSLKMVQKKGLAIMFY